MKAKNITLWVLQILVAALMILHAVVFLFPPAAVQEMMAKNPSPYPQSFMQFIFAMEALGGIGLILPAATRILPFLTPLAALGLAIIMGGATQYHIAKGDGGAAFPAVLMVMSAIIAYGRWRVVPIAPRQTAATAV